MSKYIEGETANIEEIDENYNELIHRAEETAKQKSDELRAEIAYYKRTDFSDIEAKTTTEVSQRPDDEILDREMFYHNNRKEMAHMSDEEKERMYNEALAKSRAYVLRRELRDQREKDLYYDLLTDEQVEELVKLTYVFDLKAELVEIKEEEIFKKAKIGTKERLVAQELPNIEYEVGNKVFGYVDEEKALDQEKKAKKARIKDSILGTLSVTGMSAALGAGIGAAVTQMTNIPNAQTMPAGAALLGAAALAITGAITYSDFKKTPRAIEAAKAMGLYDLIEDQSRADKALVDFSDQIDAEYGITEQMKEYDKGRSL